LTSTELLGDTKMFEQVKKSAHWVMAKMPGDTHYTVDDLMQEAGIQYIKAKRLHDDSKSAKLSTLAYQYIRNEFLILLNQEYRRTGKIIPNVRGYADGEEVELFDTISDDEFKEGLTQEQKVMRLVDSNAWHKLEALYEGLPNKKAFDIILEVIFPTESITFSQDRCQDRSETKVMSVDVAKVLGVHSTTVLDNIQRALEITEKIKIVPAQMKAKQICIKVVEKVMDAAKASDLINFNREANMPEKNLKAMTLEELKKEADRLDIEYYSKVTRKKLQALIADHDGDAGSDDTAADIADDAGEGTGEDSGEGAGTEADDAGDDETCLGCGMKRACEAVDAGDIEKPPSIHEMKKPKDKKGKSPNAADAKGKGKGKQAPPEKHQFKKKEANTKLMDEFIASLDELSKELDLTVDDRPAYSVIRTAAGTPCATIENRRAKVVENIYIQFNRCKDPGLLSKKDLGQYADDRSGTVYVRAESAADAITLLKSWIGQVIEKQAKAKPAKKKGEGEAAAPPAKKKKKKKDAAGTE